MPFAGFGESLSALWSARYYPAGRTQTNPRSSRTCNYDKIDDIAARFVRLRFAAFFRADL